MRSIARTKPASVQAEAGQVDWVSVGGFLLVAYAYSWACWIGLRGSGLPFPVIGSIGMFGPAIAALVVRLVRREPLRGLGLWPLGSFRWYVLAYLIPPAIIVIGAGLCLLTGYQRWAPHAAGLLRPGAPLTATQLMVIEVAGAFTSSAVIQVLFTLGEELGWRGHLLPRLSPLGGPVAAVAVGVIWGLWHAPVIALYGLGATVNMAGAGPTGWAFAPFFLLATVPLGVVYAWLRFRSGSVWPCVVAHAMANSGLTTVVQQALSAPGTMLLGGPVGLLGLAPAWALAVWLLATGRLRSPGVGQSVRPVRASSNKPDSE